jgi:hypothetical protein
MTAEPISMSDRIAAGRVKHGVGASEYFPGNVCHLVSPIVGFLRLRQHDGQTDLASDLDWFVDRLGLVLDMARAEAEQNTEADQ